MDHAVLILLSNLPTIMTVFVAPFLIWLLRRLTGVVLDASARAALTSALESAAVALADRNMPPADKVDAAIANAETAARDSVKRFRKQGTLTDGVLRMKAAAAVERAAADRGVKQ